MSGSTQNSRNVQELWKLFSEQKWSSAKELFHQDFEAIWPQSKERFVGADTFLGMNAEYPGNHVAQIRHLISEGDTVVCTAFIEADTGQRAIATSYFEFKDRLIIKATEYWSEHYDAPSGRAKWHSPYIE